MVEAWRGLPLYEATSQHALGFFHMHFQVGLKDRHGKRYIYFSISSSMCPSRSRIDHAFVLVTVGQGYLPHERLEV